MRVLLIVLLLSGCASAPPGPGATATGVADLARQRAEVTAALSALTAEMRAREAMLEDQGQNRAESERDRSSDALLEAYDAAEKNILEPLADRGNAEAMHRMAVRLRDSSAPDDVRRWLSLEMAASDLGHPAAHDELVRWYWHQKGDGTIEAVQRNRQTALEYASKAAAAGEMHSINRVATYVAGDVHQYPPSPEIARRLMELCARTGYAPCEQNVASKAQIARPAAWGDLYSEWAEIKTLILARGATSVGADTPCTTMTPWCRGELVRR